MMFENNGIRTSYLCFEGFGVSSCLHFLSCMKVSVPCIWIGRCPYLVSVFELKGVSASCVCWLNWDVSVLHVYRKLSLLCVLTSPQNGIGASWLIFCTEMFQCLCLFDAVACWCWSQMVLVMPPVFVVLTKMCESVFTYSELQKWYNFCTFLSVLLHIGF